MRITNDAHNSLIHRVNGLYNEARQAIRDNDESARIHAMGQLSGMLIFAESIGATEIQSKLESMFLGLHDISAVVASGMLDSF